MSQVAESCRLCSASIPPDPKLDPRVANSGFPNLAHYCLPCVAGRFEEIPKDAEWVCDGCLARVKTLGLSAVLNNAEDWVRHLCKACLAAAGLGEDRAVPSPAPAPAHSPELRWIDWPFTDASWRKDIAP